MSNFLQFNSEKSITEFIGFNGPRLCWIIAILCMVDRIPYLAAFLIASYVNDEINKILKLIIREKRPENGQSFSGEKYVGAHQYGMPSGHAQSVIFSVVFLYLVTRSPALLIVGCCIAALTIYQRFVSKKHTAGQLAVGAGVGVLVATGSFVIAKRAIPWIMKNRS